jgi:ABC-type transport system involved in multi-copper enzyme maturation permease subunit
VDRQIAAIARYTLLEALRTRLPRLVVLAAALLFAASFFVAEIAVTENARMQAGFYAACARLAAVFIAALYVLTSMTREFNDKGLDIVLALDLPRSHYILGKLCGFAAIGALTAAAACVPALWLAPAAAVLQWGLSLALEIGVVISLALFCVITFNQIMPAASFVAAFYLLARSLTAIRLMSAHPLTDAGSASHQVFAWTVEALALLMPALDGWTRTAWLVDAAPSWPEIAGIAAHGALYVALLAAAAMFDFYRKNF